MICSIMVIVAFFAGGSCSAAAGSPEVRVGSELDFPPYAFVDEKGQAAGFSVELIKSVADAMGLSIRISTGSWDSMWNSLEKLNQGLLIVKANDEYDRIYNKWLPVDDPWRKVQKYVLPAIIIVVIIIVIAGFWLVTLQRLVRKRTGELSEKNKMLRHTYEEMETRVQERTAELAQSNQLLQADIDMRKQVEEDLQKERDQAQLYLDIAEVMLVALNAQGHIILINKKGCVILGYSEQEIMGQNWFDVCLSEEMREEVAGVYNQLMKGEIAPVEYYENPVLTKDGGRRIIAFHNAVLRDTSSQIIGVLFSGEDITYRKQADELLKESEYAKSELSAKLNEAQQIAMIGSWEWNLQTNQVWWSDETYRIFGVTRHDFIPSFEENSKFIHPDDLVEYGKSFEYSLQTGEPLDIYLRLVANDGSLKHSHAKAKLFRDDSGQPIRFVGAIMDITKSKLAENKIKSLLAEKEILLREVHHRIKNNMSVITGMLSLQADTLKDPSAIFSLNDAISRVRSMMILYDKLYRTTDFREISAKKYLTSLIDEIMANFPNKGSVTVETQIDDIILDAKILSPIGIILNELLTNTMKYAFIGRDKGDIKVSLSAMDKHATLTVQDDGTGITESAKPDYGLSSTDIATSAGFGMQLVNILTEQLNGTIRIERENGTRVVLEFEI